jgi:hypothetical protein
MSSIGILNPAGALALVAVAVLVALYLYDRRQRVVPVATLFLWRQVPASALERRRFRPDGLFLLQLALLLALIAGYLRPYLEGGAPPAGGTPLVLVLDVSASMQAREESGTRFDLGRWRARALVAGLAAEDETMLLAAAERPHVLLRWSTDRGALLDRLEALAPLDTPTNLASALALALGEARARPGTRIAVFTDLAPEDSGVAPGDLAMVDYFQIGRTDDNLAIAGLVVDQPPFHGASDATATVAVRNYGRRSRRAVLEARVGAQPWARRELVLGARATDHVLLAHPPSAGVLVTTLLADDALPLDNRAVAWISPGEPLDILLVSDSRELAAAFGEIAAAIAGSRVEVVSPARYGDQPLAGRRAALFDGFVPAGMPPAVNALFASPPPGNTLCPSLRTVEGAAVIDWEAGHPALRALEALDALAVGRASQLGVPDWGRTIVLAAAHDTAFPLLVAGERNGRRLACLGAALTAPLASSDRLPLLVLTLATLRWLAEPYAATVITLETGVPALAGRGPTEPVDGPGGGAGLRAAGNPPALFAEHAGIYRLGPPGGERLVLANLFDDRESDIGRAGGGERPATVRLTTVAATIATREFGWWLYAAAAVLLALEWIAWLRQARGGRAHARFASRAGADHQAKPSGGSVE